MPGPEHFREPFQEKSKCVLGLADVHHYDIPWPETHYKFQCLIPSCSHKGLRLGRPGSGWFWVNKRLMWPSLKL